MEKMTLDWDDEISDDSNGSGLYNFEDLNRAADITYLRRISGSPKQVRTNGETELHDCCPFTGEGKDRFWIDIDRRPMTWFCRFKGSCPECSGGGDAMQFIAVREKLDRKQNAGEIAEILAREIGYTGNFATYVRPAPPIRKEPKPRTPQPPPDEWQRAVISVVSEAANRFWNCIHGSNKDPETRAALDYLHNRGITDEIIERFKIGFIPSVPTYYSYKVSTSDGKRLYRKAKENEKIITVPEGITIPTFINGNLYRVKVRKMNDRAKDKAESYNRYLRSKGKQGKTTEHDFRYEFISGSIGTALFNADAAIDVNPRKDIIICEGELDALLINSQVSKDFCGQVQAVTFGAANYKPDYVTYFKYFVLPKSITICFDNDEAGNNGAKYLLDEIEKINQIVTNKINVRVMKLPEKYNDFGDYYAAGNDINDLLYSWYPE